MAIVMKRARLRSRPLLFSICFWCRAPLRPLLQPGGRSGVTLAYPVKRGWTRPRTLTRALAVLPRTCAPSTGRPCGLPPGAAGRFGDSVVGLVPEPGGFTPGVMSAMFSSVPGAAFASTRSVTWKLTRWPARRRGITRQRRRPMRRSLRSALTNRRAARNAIADLDVAVAAGPAVAGGDPVADEAAGPHRGRVGLLVDHQAATWRTRAVTRSDAHVVEQVATAGGKRRRAPARWSGTAGC